MSLVVGKHVSHLYFIFGCSVMSGLPEYNIVRLYASPRYNGSYVNVFYYTPESIGYIETLALHALYQTEFYAKNYIKQSINEQIAEMVQHA